VYLTYYAARSLCLASGLSSMPISTQGECGNGSWHLGAALAPGTDSRYYEDMHNLDRILRECFWDTNFSGDDIRDIAAGSDERRKAQVFEKILLNSSHMLRDLELFPADELRYLLQNYQLPQFNYEHAFRRKNLAEVYYLKSELKIPELQWKR